MIIVKLTILIVLITAIYIFFWRSYLRSNPIEALKISVGGAGKGGYILSALVILSIIGILASVIWALFFR